MSTENGHVVPDHTNQLILPTHLQRQAGTARREPIARTDSSGGTVTLERVELQRGWQYEVSAEYDARDQDGPVRRRDTLWLADHHQAQRLYRAATDAVRAGAMERARGLTGLAQFLGLTFAVQ